MLGSPEDEGVCSEADVCVRERDREKEKKEGMARVHESGGGFMWGGQIGAQNQFRSMSRNTDASLHVMSGTPHKSRTIQPRNVSNKSACVCRGAEIGERGGRGHKAQGMQEPPQKKNNEKEVGPTNRRRC